MNQQPNSDSIVVGEIVILTEMILSPEGEIKYIEAYELCPECGCRGSSNVRGDNVKTGLIVIHYKCACSHRWNIRYRKPLKTV